MNPRGSAKSQKDLNTQLKEHQRALDESTILAETDLRGRITYVNDLFCKTSQYSREELIGQTHKIINSNFHPKEFFKDLWQTISTGKTWQGVIRNRAKDGTFYWVDTTIVPFKDKNGKIYKYVALRHNITPQVELQQRLQNQIEVAQKAINTSNLKTKFISNMTHEIRSGLNSVSGFSQLMDEMELPETAKSYLQRIQKSTKHILALMNDTLDLSRLEANKLVLDNSMLSLKETIEDVAEMGQANAQLKGTSIEVNLADLPPFVMGDKYRISQIFLNLMGNAIKFTENGRVILTGTVSEINSDEAQATLLFSVADTGRGIPKEKQSKIFQEYEQIEMFDSQAGTGLGLSICKRLVELMKGRIWFESEVNKGTTFYFEIPFKLPPQL